MALRGRGIVCAVMAALGCILANAATAQDDLARFWRTQGVAVVVGYAPGGGYDQSARILARYIGKYLPGNPTVIVRNMPGAGTVVAANYVNNSAPRDGSVIGLYADLLTLAPLLKVPGVQFDPRQFGWLGSMASRGTPIVVVRKDAPATTFEEALKHEILIGASGPDATSAYALLANETLGTKFKVIAGYRGGTSEISLAIERGEVHGRASGDWYTLKHHQSDWLTKNLVTVMLQMALKPHPDLKGVPLAIDLAKTEEDRQIMELVFGSAHFFRAFSTPPGVPAARLAALRTAFVQTRDDADFIKDWLVGFPAGVDFSSHTDIESFLSRVYAFSPAVIERAAKFLK
jgi:hypothetical protein